MILHDRLLQDCLGFGDLLHRPDGIATKIVANLRSRVRGVTSPRPDGSFRYPYSATLLIISTHSGLSWR